MRDTVSVETLWDACVIVKSFFRSLLVQPGRARPRSLVYVFVGNNSRESASLQLPNRGYEIAIAADPEQSSQSEPWTSSRVPVHIGCILLDVTGGGARFPPRVSIGQ